jgi:pimeloyl-ACP methyl ester carboxylesterase
MGGWIGLLVAKALGDRVKAFIGIAAAPDFTDWVWNHHMTEDERVLCKAQGYIDTPDGDTLTMRLFEDGAQHLVMDKPLYLPFPVTLLQGKKDVEVPYHLAQKLAAHITPNEVELILVDDGDHRLSRPQDLEMLGKSVKASMAQ